MMEKRETEVIDAPNEGVEVLTAQLPNGEVHQDKHAVSAHSIKKHTNANTRQRQGKQDNRVDRVEWFTSKISCALFPKRHNADKVDAKEARV